MTDVPQIIHRDDCARPSDLNRTIGRRTGDLLLRCRSCNRFTVLRPAGPEGVGR